MEHISQDIALIAIGVIVILTLSLIFTLQSKKK